MPIIRDDLSIDSLLRDGARRDPRRVYLEYEGERITLAQLDARVDAMAAGLAGAGITRGDRVPVMLGNHPEHVLVFFALQRLGAVQVPVNAHLKGESLRYLLGHCEPRRIIADAAFAAALREASPAGYRGGFIWREASQAGPASGDDDLLALATGGGAPPPSHAVESSDIITILYTSGTTGAPKGVQVTDKMLRTAAEACARLSEARDGDVFFVWEPLYHVGGAQVLVLALTHAIRLAMVPRFSASRFWEQVRARRATQIHYLGGILQMLLRQPPDPRDREHPVRVAYGGGAPAPVWREFQQRFGVPIRESYGMTEASSFSTINTDGRVGSVGRPPPWFEVRVVDEAGEPLAPGVRGEIRVRELEPGTITPGYFRNPEATTRALQGGWLHTGDLGFFDEAGYLHYAGRTKDCVRRRGENVSCWEIERVVDQMSEIEESAVVGVPDELGDETILLYARPAEGIAAGAELAARVFAWCEARLARYQTPEYVAFLAEFQKTGTQRIRKETLARGVEGAFRRAQVSGHP